MDSLFLAQVLGVVITAFAVAGLVRPQIIRSAVKDFDHESFSRLVIGCAAMAIGVGLILTHNVWEWSYRGLVTLFGWTAFLKGLMYLFAPRQIHAITKGMLGHASHLQVFLMGCLLVGLYLLYNGFWVSVA